MQPGALTILHLHEEVPVITRRRIEGDTVRVSVVTETRSEAIEQDLHHDRVEVEHVPINRVVDRAPPTREEGDVTVFSVVEEFLVVERRLLLKEEIRVRRVQVKETHRETVTLKRENAEVTRSGPESGPTDVER